ncbi:hypothetical protein IHQ71_31660 (plasmid) [Rhizobium sp. TH2]|nr:hypothetical protein IHQ71_31660 [Rhizobium sp. TH2]
MVAAGWRESEVALALADAFDDYCVYLAKRPVTTLFAANSNQFVVDSQGFGDERRQVGHA